MLTISKFRTANFKELKQPQKCYSGTVFGDMQNIYCMLHMGNMFL